MGFSSFAFIFILLPVSVLGCEWIKRLGSDRTELCLRRFLVLVSAVSALFMGVNSAAVLAASAALNGLFVLLIRREGKRRRALLASGILANLALLSCFKYFAARLPLAVSFYTFSQISLLCDLASGRIAVETPSDYLLSVLYFPKLVQGPIARYDEIIPTKDTAARRRFLSPLTADRLLSGLTLITFGLAKKTLLADTLGAAVDYAYASIPSLTAADAFLAALTYGLQLYFDFSGYCDMGMGVTRLLGIEFDGALINFNSPFKALTMEELWRRWHASLMRFFRDYVYIPLGGSRKGERRTLINLMAVFLVSGLWHGNGLNFIVWGLVNGAMVLIDRALLFRGGIRLPHAMPDSRKPKEEPPSGGRLFSGLPGALARFVLRLKTFVLFSLSFVFFRAAGLGEAAALFKQMLLGRHAGISAGFAGAFRMKELWYTLKVLPAVRGVPFADTPAGQNFCLAALLLFGAALVFFAPNAREAADRILSDEGAPEPGSLSAPAGTDGRGIRLPQVLLLAFLFVWALSAIPGVSTFLYANF